MFIPPKPTVKTTTEEQTIVPTKQVTNNNTNTNMGMMGATTNTPLILFLCAFNYLILDLLLFDW